MLSCHCRIWHEPTHTFTILTICGLSHVIGKDESGFYVLQQLFVRFQNHPEVVSRISEMEMKVMSGTTSPGLAADQLLEVFLDQEKIN